MDIRKISELEKRISELENINSASQKRFTELETKVYVLEEQLKTADLILETLVIKVDSGCTFDSMRETY
ncbi:hypothetical protein Mgra_00005071 [Meloidogyne graminicola]|uniref:Uncharacterized protein n=1 Tax=Meloidogyne graminicola TaxID=189291 RepID=A0A8S9ZQ46_9BILA|nr:hypothetical protein Mgra_00005071 [Meloidogyne graminicola]